MGGVRLINAETAAHGRMLAEAQLSGQVRSEVQLRNEVESAAVVAGDGLIYRSLQCVDDLLVCITYCFWVRSNAGDIACYIRTGNTNQ